MAGGRFAAGKIVYYQGERETGREWFEMVSHKGGRTLRAFAEMDDIDLSRDVTMALDQNAHPIDGFCRIIQNARVKCSTLFLAEQDALVCEGIIEGLGRLSQRKPTDAPLRYLGLHPLVCDALVVLARGVEMPGEFMSVCGVTNSLAANGDEGLYAMSTAIDVAYICEEPLTVGAGAFLARRYALRWQPDWPPADLWVHGDQALFLCLSWTMIDARYELTELRTHR